MAREGSVSKKAGRVHRPVAARCLGMAAACLVTLGANAAHAQAAAPPVRRYENPEYLFTVRYPLGLPIARSSGPGPNHGLDVQVAPGATAWVFAGYEMESASTLAEEVAEQRELWHDCTVIEQKSGTLGGRPAAELTFECPVKAGHGPPNTMKLLFTLQTPPDRGPVVYEVGLQYPKGSRAGPNTERVYRTLAEGFSFTWPAAARSE